MSRLMFIFAILLVFTIIVCTKVNAYEGSHDCDRNPIYCQIVKNKPTIKRTYAFKMSNIIHSITTKYKLEPHLFTAILAQESMYDMTAKNCTSGLIKKIHGVRGFVGEVIKVSEYFEQNTVCTDFGIGQIWHKTATSYDFDISRLTTDLEYSIEAAAIVLKDFKNMYGKKEHDWWTRYNARSRKARDKYKNLVNRYINAN